MIPFRIVFYVFFLTLSMFDYVRLAYLFLRFGVIICCYLGVWVNVTNDGEGEGRHRKYEGHTA